MNLEQIILIILTIQFIIGIVSVIFAIVEMIICEFPTGGPGTFFFIFIVSQFPLLGTISAIALCIDCVNNIKGKIHMKHNEIYKKPS